MPPPVLAVGLATGAETTVAGTAEATTVGVVAATGAETNVGGTGEEMTVGVVAATGETTVGNEVVTGLATTVCVPNPIGAATVVAATGEETMVGDETTRGPQVTGVGATPAPRAGKSPTPIEKLFTPNERVATTGAGAAATVLIVEKP